MWQETKTLFLTSLSEVLRAAARILPSVFAMLLFLALAAVAALVVRWAVLRGCARLGLDARLREWGVSAPGAPGRTPPSRLIARVSYWTILAAGTFFALSIVDAPAMTALSLQLVQYLPRVVVALVVFWIGVGGARVAERGVLIGAVNAGLQSASLLALAARWLIVVLASAIALEQAGVGSGVVLIAFGTLFGGIVLALALAVGLGARELVARSLERRFPGEPPRDAQTPPPATTTGRIQHL